MSSATDPLEQTRLGRPGRRNRLHQLRAVVLRAVDGPADLPGCQLAIRDVLAALKPAYEDPAILKIGHDVKYEQLLFARFGLPARL